MADHTITLSDAAEAAWTADTAARNALDSDSTFTVDDFLTGMAEAQGQALIAQQQAQAVTAIGIALAADPTLTAATLTSAGLPSDAATLSAIAATGTLDAISDSAEPSAPAPEEGIHA